MRETARPLGAARRTDTQVDLVLRRVLLERIGDSCAGCERCVSYYVPEHARGHESC